MNDTIRKTLVFTFAVIGLTWSAYHYLSHKSEITSSMPTDIRPVTVAATPVDNTSLINVTAETKQTWGEDPFRPWPPSTPARRKATRTGPAPAWHVNGVLYNDNNPLAYVNGRSARIGDSVDGATIVAIGRKSVTFRRDGKDFTVAVNKG